MIEKPKKERRFLKALGRVGEILIQEVLIKIGSNLIKKIGGKKTLPSILFLLVSLSLFAQYPATGNKQRLGFQTTGDGLVFRGRASDTVALKSSTINNAYFILDTVNNVLFNYIKTKGGWVFNNTDTVINNITVDTTSLSNRINLKLNISDTASMLVPYFKDLDTTSLNLTSRFAAKLNISDTASMLTNYLRTGVAASTYQTILTNPITGTGTINYIPKFTSTGSTIGSSGLINDANFLFINPNDQLSFGWDYMTNTSNPFIGSNVKNGTSNERIQKAASSTLFNPSAIIFGYQRVNNSSSAVSFGGINFVTTSGNPVGDINPIDFTRMFIATDGNIGIGTMQPSFKLDIQGTLNVTGATTLSEPLTVNSSAVFNEGSTDSDFRVESDGNVNMVFVDASTDRVGIGINTPDKTLHVNGEVKIATVTATPTSLLGKDGSNVVGTVTTLAQTGLMKAGGTTTNTSSVGIITVAHGLPYTPSQVFVTLAQQSSYVIVCHSITSSNMLFTVYDSITGLALDNVSVGFFWLAIK